RRHAAGFVRRGLQAEGFDMSRIPGYGRKREMLIGHYRTAKRHDALLATPAKVIVIGAGLAGATCARALAELNIPVTIYDPQGIANGASGNLAGVVYTTPSGHPTAQNRFYQQSYLHALHWLARYQFPASPDQGALEGVIQLPKDLRHREKAHTALNSGFWPDSVVKAAPGWPESTLNFVAGGYIAPQRWCEHLLNHPLITLQQDSIAGLIRRDASKQNLPATHQTPDSQNTLWAIMDDQGREMDQAPHVVLANSFDALQLHTIEAVKLKRIRGQVSHVRAQPASSGWRQAFCHSGYLTPAIQGLHCVGASFDLHRHDPAADDQDDRANLEELKRNLPEHWQALGGNNIELDSRRVGFRCQSTDFLPLAGKISEGLWCSIAHGSRGITGTPLCAELIANGIAGLPAAVDREMLDALSPSRFMLRHR
ncbi:MAG: amino acid oxidase, partial [Gammaproteobacteria bacterium HGW-Gammaproteobacteria-14]